jgi:hypothetical protein
VVNQLPGFVIYQFLFIFNLHCLEKCYLYVVAMRFNQKELAFIALQPAETFDLQGLLWLKEKDGYFWQRTECEFFFQYRVEYVF